MESLKGEVDGFLRELQEDNPDLVKKGDKPLDGKDVWVIEEGEGDLEDLVPAEKPKQDPWAGALSAAEANPSTTVYGVAMRYVAEHLPAAKDMTTQEVAARFLVCEVAKYAASQPVPIQPTLDAVLDSSVFTRAYDAVVQGKNVKNVHVGLYAELAGKLDV